jgi:hypothetical protein
MDVLSVGPGQLVAALRYQTDNQPAGFGIRPRYKQSAVQVSSDYGFSFSAARVVTGYLQQSACLVQTAGADGTDRALVLVFGYKPAANMPRDDYGQRFIVSYDNGTSWSNRIFRLHRGGMYASSAVAVDDTIVTVLANGSALEMLRWRLPARSRVAANGFFRPSAVETAGVGGLASGWM